MTRAGLAYPKGCTLDLIERTEDAPHGYSSSLGNWVVVCPFQTSVWSNIEGMIAEGELSYKCTLKEAEQELEIFLDRLGLGQGDKDALTPLKTITLRESEQWAKAITSWIDKQGGDGPSLWEWSGKCPTPDQVVNYLDHLLEIRLEIAANEELDACCGTIKRKGWFADPTFRINELIRERRPSPTLKEQALRDLATVRQCSDVLPEILDTIELALDSIPDPKKEN